MSDTGLIFPEDDDGNEPDNTGVIFEEDGSITFTNIVRDAAGNPVVGRDGGHPKIDILINGEGLKELRARMPLWNIRGDHQRGDGGEFWKTPKKILNWSGQLADEIAIYGNMVANLNPNRGRTWLDRIGLHTTCPVDSPDAVSRLRAAFLWIDTDPDPEQLRRTMFSISFYFAPSVLHGDNVAPGAFCEEAIFDALQNEGKPVERSTCRWFRPRTNLEEMVVRFVANSEHLRGNDNVARWQDSISSKDRRLCAFNTFVMAFNQSWTAEPAPGDLEWVITAWDELVVRRPEFGICNQDDRLHYRETLISSNTVMIFAIVRALAVMRQREITSVDVLDRLDRLNERTTDDAGESIDFLSLSNPLFRRRGIVHEEENGDGKMVLKPQNRFAHRRAMKEVLLDWLRLRED